MVGPDNPSVSADEITQQEASGEVDQKSASELFAEIQRLAATVNKTDLDTRSEDLDKVYATLSRGTEESVFSSNRYNNEYTEQKKFLEQYKKKLKLKSKISVVRLRLSAHGVKNVRDLCTELELETLAESIIHISPSGKVSEKILAEADKKLTELFDKLNTKPVLDKLSLFDNYKKTKDRFFKITNKRLTYTWLSLFDEAQLNLLVKIDAISDDDWDRVFPIISMYPFLFAERLNTEPESPFQFTEKLLPLFNPDFPLSELLSVLDILKKIFAIRKTSLGEKFPLLQVGNFKDLLLVKDRLSQELVIWETCVREQAFGYSTMVNIITQRIDDLSQAGLLSRLADKIEAGWHANKVAEILTTTDYQRKLVGLSYGPNWHVEELKKIVEQAEEISAVQPEDNLYLDLVDTFVAGDKKLAGQHNLWMKGSLEYTETTLRLLKQDAKELFLLVCTFVAKLEIADAEKQELLSSIFIPDKHMGILITDQGMTKLTQLAEGQNQLIFDKAKVVWQRMRDNHAYGMTLLSDYLLRNGADIAKLGELFDENGKMNSEFFLGFVDHIFQLPNVLFDKVSAQAAQENKKTSLMTFEKAVLFGDMCPPEWQELVNFIQSSSYETVLKKAINGKEAEWSHLVVNGNANSRLFELLIQEEFVSGYFPNFTVDIEQAMPNFSSTQQEFWTFWLNASTETKIQVGNKLKIVGQLTPEFVSSMKTLELLIKRVQQSSSSEIRKFQDQIVGILIDGDEPEALLEQIVLVFEQNNLPDVAKVYRVFEIIHKHKTMLGGTQFEEKIERKKLEANLCPTLLELGERARYGLIYQDLVRIAVDSNNASLRTFIETIRWGESLVAKLETDGEDQLTPDEKKAIEGWMQKFDAVLALTQLSRIYPEQPKATGALTLTERVHRLKAAFVLSPQQTMSDRVVELFGRPLGLNTVDDVLKRMSESVADAGKRCSEYYDSDPSTFKFQSGDLLKGFSPKYLGFLMNNGATSPEFLGDASGDDRTPFGTDVSMVLDTDLGNGIHDVLGKSHAIKYTEEDGLLLVVRNRGQFQLTEQGQKADTRSGQYEIYWSRFLDAANPSEKRHFDIRTGIPSSEYDAVIAMPELVKKPAEIRRLAFMISLSGRFIPIIDAETGSYLNTPEMFNADTVNLEQLRAQLSNNAPSETLMQTLEGSDYLKNLLDDDNHKLKDHTIKVLSQYEKYFKDGDVRLPLAREGMRLLFLLHDIGKPMAIAIDGTSKTQHEHTNKIVIPLLLRLGIDQRTINMITAIARQDILGEYFKEDMDLDHTIDKVVSLAQETWLETDALLELLRVYYMSDASAYTQDAGGETDLDILFVFNEDPATKVKTIKLESELETKFEILRNRLSTVKKY